MKRLFTSFFILFTASGLWAQESYASGSKSFSGRGLTSIPIAISDAGTITDLNVKIKLDHGYDEGLRHTSISLLSPYGTAIILASGDQVGGSWSGTAGGQLYSTVFDDEASTSIYSNNAPFAGSYIPAKPLSSFDKESMTGTWEVLINNKREETGTVEITIMVESDNSTPDPAPNYGANYASGSKSFSGRGLTSIPIAISDAGTITDLNVKIKLDHGYDEGLRHTSISLLSPYGTAIILASGDQVGGSWSGTAGGQLYSTVFDDEASTSIYSNNAPFAGSYIPAKPLSSFDKESMTGTWEVLINNKREETGTVEITIMVVTQPPLADFTATPTSGQVPLAVQFTDQSVDIDGTVVSWSWNFGDGNTSTEQNPSHTYETHGVYDVSLSATDNVGQTGIETKEDYITANYSGPVWYVSNDGDDSGQGTEDDPFETINYAVNQSSSGDSVLVFEGTYGEIHIDEKLFIGSVHFKNIDSTIIQNTQVERINTNANSDSTEIFGLNVVGGDNGIELDGLGAVKGMTIFINFCHITAPKAGIYSTESNAYIDNSIITGCKNAILSRSDSRRSITVNNSEITGNDDINWALIGTINNSFLNLTINNSEISNNTGGTSIIHLDDGSLNLNNVQIIDNDIGNYCIGTGNNTSEKVLDNVVIDNNSGVGIYGIRNATITNCTISNNIGGGIQGLYNSVIENTTISGNKILGSVKFFL
ncbi:MAG: PKD domain-containing protein [Candidatus Marinimicrobia bacterium]|nr:PKD domain-containing protein [Candidatus Neomarinimicrobiota bacterium]